MLIIIKTQKKKTDNKNRHGETYYKCLTLAVEGPGRPASLKLSPMKMSGASIPAALSPFLACIYDSRASATGSVPVSRDMMVDCSIQPGPSVSVATSFNCQVNI